MDDGSFVTQHAQQQRAPARTPQLPVELELAAQQKRSFALLTQKCPSHRFELGSLIASGSFVILLILSSVVTIPYSEVHFSVCTGAVCGVD